MAFSLSSLDVHYLVRELRSVIQDSFVDKIYQSKDEKGDFLIKLRSPKTGKQQLYLKVPDAFFLTDHRYVWPQDPVGFCMQLRKHLHNTQLVSIEQHGFERIIELVFKKGDVHWKLIVELFSKGNVVLVNSDGLIRGVMDLQRWKDRTLRVNAPYEYPPLARKTASLSVEEISSLLEKNDKEIVKFCATNFGLGGKYAEELVARSKIDKNKVSLSVEEIAVLHEQLHALFSLPLEPVICDDDAAPFSMRAWDDEVSCESFSAAIESLVVAEKIDGIQMDVEKSTSKVTGKWQKIIDEQTNKVNGYELAAKDNQRKGELIYEHYQELKILFSSLKELHAKGGWSRVKEYIKEKNLPLTVDEKKGIIVFPLA